ncbi:hypothetical protein C8T65DRAFT_668648 [Cerioporus squamosus]|nr:hypothetical protein C8T65DRAFT_668648 [Cerioporus squamosus]
MLVQSERAAAVRRDALLGSARGGWGIGTYSEPHTKAATYLCSLSSCSASGASQLYQALPASFPTSRALTPGWDRRKSYARAPGQTQVSPGLPGDVSPCHSAAGSVLREVSTRPRSAPYAPLTWTHLGVSAATSRRPKAATATVGFQLPRSTRPGRQDVRMVSVPGCRQRRDSHLPAVIARRRQVRQQCASANANVSPPSGRCALACA